jgi:mannosyltransferase OCH1-like enzyme
MKNIFIITLLIIMIVVFKYHTLFLYKEIPNETFSEKSRITMYRTSKTRIVNKKMYTNCYKKWLDQNKDLSIIWFNDIDTDNYMKTQDKSVQDSYKRLLPGAFKADLFRLCILYEKGGLYVDCETTPYISIKKMMEKCIIKENNHFFVSILDCPESGGGVHNGFIYCSPKHPFIKKYIEIIIKNVSKKIYTNSPLGITGPLCFNKAINKLLNNKYNHKFKEGMNEYGDLSFYLYKLVYGPFQYVYTNNKIIMSKKHCLLSYCLNKLKSNSYSRLWSDKKVYDLKHY